MRKLQKLTEDQYTEILQSRERPTVLAKRYGVSRQMIHKIRPGNIAKGTSTILTPEQVAEIKASTEYATALAIRYGVSSGYICSLFPGRIVPIYSEKRNGRRTLSDHLCECDCGGFTYICTETHKHNGNTRGQPYRFLKGHHAKVWKCRKENENAK